MFDNPFFWIVAIWWLVSNFLGKSKRRRLRQVERVPIEEPEEPLFEEPLEGAAPISPDPPAAGPEPESEPVYPQSPRPAVPLRATLKGLWRKLEMELEGVTQPVDSAPVPEPPVPPKAPVMPPPPPVVARRERAYEDHDTDSWGKRTTYRQPPLERYSSRWTVAQQAVIFREIIGPPVALRKARQR